MLGTESLWNSALLQQTPPNKLNDCYTLLTHDPLNTHVFHSQLFLSAVLHDPVFKDKEIAEQTWFKAHGFTDMLKISFEEYLHIVVEYNLVKSFEEVLSIIPTNLYYDVVNVCAIAFFEWATEPLYILLPALMRSELKRLKMGGTNIWLDCFMSFIPFAKSANDNGPVEPEFLAQGRDRITLQKYSPYVINEIVNVCFDVMNVLGSRGPCMLITRQEGFCGIEKTCCQTLLQMGDVELEFLHLKLNLICCEFKTVSEKEVEEMKGKCCEFQNYCLRFFKQLALLDFQEYLTNLFAFATFLVNSQSSKFYEPDFISALREIQQIIDQSASKPDTTSIFKALNFSPDTASWSELMDQCRYKTSKSDNSFKVMISRLDQAASSKLRDVIGLFPHISPGNMSWFIKKVFIKNMLCVPEDMLAEVVQELHKDLDNKDLTYLRMIAKDLYSASSEDNISSDVITGKLGHLNLDFNNITKLVNQLANQNNNTSKDKLIHEILKTFIFYPEAVISELFLQGSINKSVSIIIASLLSENISFVIRMGQSVPPLAFKSLKTSFLKLTSGKSVKVFHQFISLAINNGLISEEMVLRWIILPNLHSRKALLTTLQFSALFMKTYNLTFVYLIAQIWSTASSEEIVNLLDEIISNVSQDLTSVPPEELRYLCCMLEDVAWWTSVRFFQFFISCEHKLTLSRFGEGSGINVENPLFSFVSKPIQDMDEIQFIFTVIKYCPRSKELLTITRSCFHRSIVLDFMSGLSKLPINSEFEWNNLYDHLKNIISFYDPLEDEFPLNSLEGTQDLVDVGLDPEKFIERESTPSLSTWLMYSILISEDNRTHLLRWWGAHCHKTINSPDEDSSAPVLQIFIHTCLILHKRPSQQSLVEITLLDVLPNVLKTGPREDVERGILLLPEKLRATVSQKMNFDNRQ